MPTQLNPPASFLGSLPVLFERIRAEYRAIPGLLLTEVQARRLFNLDADVCTKLLDALCDEGFLARNPTGRFGLRSMH